MGRIRRIGLVLVSAWSAGLVMGIVLRVLTDLRGTEGRALVVGAMVLGGVAGYRGLANLTPLNGQERRDAVVGWGIVGGLIAVSP